MRPIVIWNQMEAKERRLDCPYAHISIRSHPDKVLLPPYTIESLPAEDPNRVVLLRQWFHDSGTPGHAGLACCPIPETEPHRIFTPELAVEVLQFIKGVLHACIVDALVFQCEGGRSRSAALGLAIGEWLGLDVSACTSLPPADAPGYIDLNMPRTPNPHVLDVMRAAIKELG